MKQNEQVDPRLTRIFVWTTLFCSALTLVSTALLYSASTVGLWYNALYRNNLSMINHECRGTGLPDFSPPWQFATLRPRARRNRILVVSPSVHPSTFFQLTREKITKQNKSKSSITTEPTNPFNIYLISRELLVWLYYWNWHRLLASCFAFLAHVAKFINGIFRELNLFVHTLIESLQDAFQDSIEEDETIQRVVEKRIRRFRPAARQQHLGMHFGRRHNRLRMPRQRRLQNRTLGGEMTKLKWQQRQ